MIDTKELRIGNWVVSKNSGKEVQLTGVSSDSKELYGPIPLAEEWLLKFGFEEFDKEFSAWGIGYAEHRFPEDKNGKIGGFDYYTTEFELSINEDDSWYVEEHAVILKYVHQLQNLYFALTGKELTIKE